MFDADAPIETTETVVAFRAPEAATEAPAAIWPNPRHPLAFQLAMALIEQTEYDAA